MMTPEAWLDSHKEDFIRACQRVLRINSVKAAPEPGKPFGPGVYDCLVEALKIADELGLDTKNVDGYAGRIQAGEGDEIVGILSHLDVVPEGEGWTYPPYSGAYVDGCLYSRGAGDNKGPSMAALFALAAVAQSGAKFTRRVHLIFGCDEESGWDDMAYYGAHERMPDMGFSPDASFPVTHAEKGIMHVDLVAEGADPTCPVRSIQSGTRANIVAERAQMEVDVRTWTLAEAQRIDGIIQGLQPTRPGISLEVSGGIGRPALEFTPANQQAFALAQQAAEELGQHVEGAAVGGGSDGNFTSALGVPTLDGLGAVGDGPHAEREHIELSRYLPRVALLANLLTKF